MRRTRRIDRRGYEAYFPRDSLVAGSRDLACQPKKAFVFILRNKVSDGRIEDLCHGVAKRKVNPKFIGTQHCEMKRDIRVPRDTNPLKDRPRSVFRLAREV